MELSGDRTVETLRWLRLPQGDDLRDRYGGGGDTSLRLVTDRNVCATKTGGSRERSVVVYEHAWGRGRARGLLLGLLLAAEFGVDEGVEFAAVEDGFDVVGFVVGAVVFD